MVLEQVRKKDIFLTFDDGPDRKYTPKILDILKKFDAKASFFVVGKNAKKNPGIIKRIYDEGHDIGNHTYTHPVSPVLRSRKIDKEILLTERIIRRITGQKPLLFRPTWADWDINSKKMLNTTRKLGYLSVRWSLSSVDWLGSGLIIRQKILNRNMNPREILLFHDGAEKAPVNKREATVKLLPYLLKQSNNKHINFRKLSGYITKRSDIF